MRVLAVALFGAALLVTAAGAQDPTYRYPPGPSYRTCSDTLTIYDVQQPDTLLAPCHPMAFGYPLPADTVLGVRGIITGFDARPSSFAFYIQKSGGGPYDGVQVFTGFFNWHGSPYDLAIGDLVAVYGTVQEFPATDGTTWIEGPDIAQLTNDIVIRKISSGHPLTYDIVDTRKLDWIPGSPGGEGEQWEGGLVRIRGPLRVGRASTQGGAPTLPFGSFLVVSAGSPEDSVLVDGNVLFRYPPPPPGTVIDSLQGLVTQNNTSGMNYYRVQVRDSGDVFMPLPTGTLDQGPVAGPGPRPIDRLGASFPDPAFHGVTITYSLARGRHVQLVVFDLGGRFVRTLVEDEMPEGVHTATWDGTDRRGRPVPAGLYVYRMKTDGFSSSRRLALVR